METYSDPWQNISSRCLAIRPLSSLLVEGAREDEEGEKSGEGHVYKISSKLLGREALATCCRLHFRSVVKVLTLREMSCTKSAMDLSNPVLPALTVCGSPVVFNISFPKQNMLDLRSRKMTTPMNPVPILRTP